MDQSKNIFLLNADAHYAVQVGMSSFPESILGLIDDFGGSIGQMFKTYSPIFPAEKITRKVRSFIVEVLKSSFDAKSANLPSELFSKFEIVRAQNGNSFATSLSQTQFVDQFMQSSVEPFRKKILNSFWPTFQIPKRKVTQKRKSALPVSNPEKMKKVITAGRGVEPDFISTQYTFSVFEESESSI